MPAIILVLLLSLLTGCYDDQPENKHGLSKFTRSQYGYRGIVDRSIKLTFNVVKGPVSKLTARIEIPYDYNHPLTYQWKLGEGVTISSGQLTGEIEQMQKNVPLEIELNVNGFNEDVARFVRFEVLGSSQQKRAFADGIINSTDKSFEKIVQEVELYKKANQ